MPSFLRLILTTCFVFVFISVAPIFAGLVTEKEKRQEICNKAAPDNPGLQMQCVEGAWNEVCSILHPYETGMYKECKRSHSFMEPFSEKYNHSVRLELDGFEATLSTAAERAEMRESVRSEESAQKSDSSWLYFLLLLPLFFMLLG